MQAHPYFDLRVHDDDELSTLLGSTVRAREPLHAWPLSAVERIDLADGRVYVYKAQRAPTVEPAFYTAMAAAGATHPAVTQVLVPARTLWEDPPYACMLLDYVAGPRLDQVARRQQVSLALCAAVDRAVANLPQAAPVYQDLSAPQQWHSLAAELLELLRTLEAEGVWRQVQRSQIDALAALLAGTRDLAAACTDARLLHGDLTAENVFLTDAGVRIIDWQRPLLGPPALDRATLLASLGIDPTPHVGATIVNMQRLLQVHWLAECALRWFPAGRESYDRQIARLLGEILAG